MNLRRAAETLGVSYPTALKYVQSGALLAVKKGGAWDISEEEIIRFEVEGNAVNKSEGAE